VREQQDPARLHANAVVSAIVWHLQPFVRSLQLVIQWIRITGHVGEARGSPSLVPSFRVRNQACSGEVIETVPSGFGKLRFVMNKTRILLITIIGLAAVLSVLAQEQSQTQPSSQVPAIDLQGVRNYLLGPGDVLDVRVFGQSELNTLAEIDGDGNVSSLPFLEKPIRAMCLTEKEVQRTIAAAYGAYIKNPQVSVRITQRNSRPPATLYGAVHNPMLITMMRRVRLHELIARSGGITERASGTVQVIHTQPEMCPEAGEMVMKRVSGTTSVESQIEYFKLRELGSDSGDPFIRPGDVVIVTEGEPVYVTGAVLAPQPIFMKDQLTLGRAIAMAGGAQRLANTTEVHVYRKKDGAIGQEDLKYNYDAIKKGRDKDVLLQPYDIIDVKNAGAFSGKNLKDLFLNMSKSSIGFLPQRVLY
jgi:polysaccharide export outer membrane protein